MGHQIPSKCRPSLICGTSFRPKSSRIQTQNRSLRIPFPGSFLNFKFDLDGKRHSFSLLPIIRQNKKNKQGEAPVYLRITCDGKRLEVSVKISVEPAKWHAAKGRIKGNTEEIRRLNQSIETFEHWARKIYNKCMLNGKVVTADTIKNGLIVPAAN